MSVNLDAVGHQDLDHSCDIRELVADRDRSTSCENEPARRSRAAISHQAALRQQAT